MYRVTGHSPAGVHLQPFRFRPCRRRRNPGDLNFVGGVVQQSSRPAQHVPQGRPARVDGEVPALGHGPRYPHQALTLNHRK